MAVIDVITLYLEVFQKYWLSITVGTFINSARWEQPTDGPARLINTQPQKTHPRPVRPRYNKHQQHQILTHTLPSTSQYAPSSKEHPTTPTGQLHLQLQPLELGNLPQPMNQHVQPLKVQATNNDIRYARITREIKLALTQRFKETLIIPWFSRVCACYLSLKPNLTFMTLSPYQTIPLLVKSGNKKMIRKSSGLDVFVKNEKLPFVEELITGSEYVLWIKIAKSYILMMI